MEAIPTWASGSLQALAYWIGWSHERYPHWPIPEGAMAAEVQAQIDSKLPSRSTVAIAEVQVHDLVSPSHGATGKERIDLVIADRVSGRRPSGGEIREATRCLIEVKRGQAAWSEIEYDLVRLALLAEDLPGPCRAFLIVGCQAGRRRPRRLVTPEGTAVRTTGYVAGGTYRTRRVYAASPTRARTSSVHLVALVEVWPAAV
jgi:hypothetical protein